MTAIIALDPGKTTGIAIRTESGNLSFSEEEFHDACSIVEQFVAFNDNAHVVTESFIITPNTAKNTQAPWSLELIGVFRFLTKKYLDKDIVLQTPANAKRFSSDSRLKKIGYWTPGKGHANDAARHLLLFEAQRGYLSKDQLREFVTIT